MRSRTDPRRQWLIPRLVWGYSILASIVLVGLGIWLPPRESPGFPAELLAALLAVGVADVGALLWLRAIARRRAEGAGPDRSGALMIARPSLNTYRDIVPSLPVDL